MLWWSTCGGGAFGWSGGSCESCGRGYANGGAAGDAGSGRRPRERGMVCCSASPVVQRLTRGESDQGPSRSGWSFLNWRRLSPQAQIRLLYLSTLRRAGEQGVQRARHQTPSEVAPLLEARWPEVGEELEALTRAFVRARYGTDSISSGDVQRTRQVWKRVRTALRGGQRTVNPH